MTYLQITIILANTAEPNADGFQPPSGTNLAEILIACLAESGYEGFEETENCLHAFIPEEQFDRKELEDLLAGWQLEYSRTLIAQKNWNEEWERNFQPVVVGGFCAVRAFFHAPVEGVEHELIITPKMSFGTGHHATTYMMMEAMQYLDFAGVRVLDFGTGTGVLAILAERLGARQVLAIDHDEWSIENARENIAINRCRAISVEKKEEIPSKGLFEVILANINKNTILRELHAIGQHLADGGVILLSGLLQDDFEDIEKKAIQNNLSISVRVTKENWICLNLGKISNK